MLQSIQRADHALYASITDRKYAANIATVARWVSRSGDGHLYLVLGVLAMLLDGQHGTQFFIVALTAFAFELPFYFVIKNVFKRNRPCEVLLALPAFVKPSDKFSLPSGHTAAAFIMATVVAQFYPDIASLCYAWAALIGASRVLLRVHFPTDILCGFALGASAAWISLAMWV
ncbi:phosphatase PAP2 family protein [Echinimonas agarilytica]|uniref:undecaprenyl-diphosphate phosphatase n=1 Tax=Echinimonas agarilytica TaxID=1215918 RepID=A0AA41W409_9GAMM|nr:phosphatase PAP2 family protein [Echinimonas agarilytica]MCM2678305.1 phosphatase PAP2 family protein [Echinimonas agarilytica]